MKTTESPRKGKIGQYVAVPTRFGQCYRILVHPRDAQSGAQMRMRRILGICSHGWGVNLTEFQRALWITAALNATSRPWFGQYGHLSGQQLCIKINSTLRCIGKAPVTEPPAPVVFAASPVGQLSITNDTEAGVRLLLNVGAVTEDIMLFAQAPCSRGRTKHRRVCYLGLLPAAANGQSDITALYTARFGQPAPGQKVFVVTCQEKNGWKANDQLTNAIVPPRSLPGEQQTSPVPQAPEAAPAVIPASQQAPSEPFSPSQHAVYKRSAPGAQGEHRLTIGVHPVSLSGAPDVHSLEVAIRKLFRLVRLASATE